MLRRRILMSITNAPPPDPFFIYHNGLQNGWQINWGNKYCNDDGNVFTISSSSTSKPDVQLISHLSPPKHYNYLILIAESTYGTWNIAEEVLGSTQEQTISPVSSSEKIVFDLRSSTPLGNDLISIKCDTAYSVYFPKRSLKIQAIYLSDYPY